MPRIQRYGGTSLASLVDIQSWDPDSEEGRRIQRDIERAYPLPRRAAESEEAQEKFDQALGYLLEYGKGTRVQRVVERAIEGLDADIFSTFLRRTVHIKLLDGFADPAYRNWEPFIDEVEFTDFEDNESVRFENPSDLVQREFYEGPVPNEELVEYNMPTWRGRVFYTGFEIPFDTTRIEDLGARIRDMFNRGVAANRTLEKFVFQDNLQANPSLTVDDTSQNLFADSHTGGTDNDLNSSVTAFSYAQLEAIVKLIGAQTIDGEVMDLRPRYLVCRAMSQNHFNMMEALSPRHAIQPGTTNVGDVKVLGLDMSLDIIATPVLDVDSWFVICDTDRAPGVAFEVGYLDGEDSPELVDLDMQDSPFYRRTGINRWIVRMGWGGTWRDFRGVYRGSPAS